MNFVFTLSKKHLLFFLLLALTSLQARPDNILNNTPCADGVNWTSHLVPVVNSGWQSVTYGNGLFVAVSYNSTNRVMTSPNGSTWTGGNAAQNNQWRSVTYGNGLFVAVSDDGTNRVMTSPDGITWTSRNAAQNNQWQSVTYGNGLFVAVSDNGTNQVMTSPDGITWTSRNAAQNTFWRSVTYGNGLFVAVAEGWNPYSNTNLVMTSPDGITWTGRSVPFNSWNAVTYGNGLFVAVALGASANQVVTSPDGITWTSRTTPNAYFLEGITYANNLFVAIGYSGALTSPDGIAWTSNNVPGTNNSVVYGNGRFVAVGTGVISSSAGIAPTISIAANTGNSIGSGTTVTFTATPNGGGTTPTYQWKKNGVNVGTNDTTYTDANLANGDAITVEMVRTAPCPSSATAISNTVTMTVTSPCPGVPWTSRNAAQNNAWQSITYGNGIFVAVANTGTNRVMTSPDGINWTNQNAAQANEWRSVTYGNGLFVAVSYTGTNRVMTSPDGITWTSRNAAQNNSWYGVTYGNGLFVAVAGDGTNRVMTSPDGINWTSRNAAEANGWWDLTYANGMYVAVAYSGTNRIMTSPDGITWTSRSNIQSNWSSIIYADNKFVAVANSGTNRVATSPDGITWTVRNAGQSNWSSVTYGNGLFVAVAYIIVGSSSTHRVMTSPDGITWTNRNAAQANHWTCVAYGNNLFVALSRDGTNRVMTSSGEVLPLSVSIASSVSGTITVGTSVTFTATPVNSGTAPTYQWKKNGVNVGTNAATYTDTDLADGDFITVQMTRTTPCASSTTVTSDTVTMEVVCTRLYVTENGTGNGSSWTNAMNDLQAAINNTCGATEIWVAAGTYKPTQHPDPATTADPRAKCFHLNQNRQIYGGFAGTETQLSQRNPATNPTILSGDIGTVGSDADNCYHVVITTGLTAAAVIDGFTVRDGKGATSAGSISYSGISFDNRSGGGFYNDNSSPTVSNVIVRNNSASYGGGGFYNIEASWLTIINVVVSNNSADYGGGFYNRYSSPTLRNVMVHDNSANNAGGFYNSFGSSPTLTNVTVSNNSASNVAGLFNYFNSSPAIRNSIIWNNGSSEVYNNYNSTPHYAYCIVKGSGGSSAWISSYGANIGNNLDTDPLFVSTTDFTLQASSPAINSGDDAVWAATGLTTDLAGNARPVGIVDRGAYENQSVVPVEFLYFTGEATENGNLLTWATATEENNAGFEVEKSTDARTFEKIGFVIGNGTTYEQQNYEFLDKNTTNGTTYYRLKQLDFDGKFEYSNIVSISNANATINEVALYPNPVKDILTIENAAGFATIYNALGQPVRQFEITDAVQMIEVNDLPKGVYTLQIRKTDGTAVIKQFIK